MHNRVITLIAAVLSFSVQAEWSYFGVANNGDKHYMDFSTIRKTPNGYRVWEIIDYKNIEPRGVLSLQLVYEYNCTEDKVRVLQETQYAGNMGKGKIIGDYYTPSEWAYIPPQSMGEAGLKIVCGKKR